MPLTIRTRTEKSSNLNLLAAYSFVLVPDTVETWLKSFDLGEADLPPDWVGPIWYLSTKGREEFFQLWMVIHGPEYAAVAALVPRLEHQIVLPKCWWG